LRRRHRFVFYRKRGPRFCCRWLGLLNDMPLAAKELKIWFVAVAIAQSF
jgi:hypothetical protein